MRNVEHIIEEKISNGINFRTFREIIHYGKVRLPTLVRKNIRVVEMARRVRSDIQKHIEQ